MKPIARLIRMGNIAKCPSQKVCDEAQAEYLNMIDKDELEKKIDEIEVANSDGWDAWSELKDWIFERES